jgi:HSP90 family molecular chaperone
MSTTVIPSRPWQLDAVSIHVLLDSKGNCTVTQSDKSEEPGTSLVLNLNSHSEFLLDNDVLEEIVLAFCALATAPETEAA